MITENETPEQIKGEMKSSPPKRARRGAAAVIGRVSYIYFMKFVSVCRSFYLIKIEIFYPTGCA